MMDPSEINNFEDQWRKALKEASEAPPQSVWEGIEARLDQQEGKGILPLWWQSSKIWYAAASIAALLLVGGGIWYSNSGLKGNKADMEVAVKENARESVSPEKESPESNAQESADVNKGQLALKETKETSKAVPNPENGKENEALAFEKSSRGASDVLKNNALGSDNKGSLSAAKNSDSQQNQGVNNSFAKVDKPEIAPIDNAKSNVSAASAIEERAVAQAPAVSAETEMAVAQLSALPYSNLDVHMQKRYIFFRPDVIKEEVAAPVKNKEYYAAVSLMPASFNPNLTVKEAPQAFSNQGLSMRKAVSGSSESGASYAVQTQGGVKLSKHWSLEMGVSYLKGNSSYEGGGYVLNAFNNRSANVLENALADLAPSPSNAYQDKNGFFANNGALYIDVAKTVSNNYQYLQLPVQAGFTVFPEKKLSYSVLGGMMANFFLSNELESASGEIITTKASDEIYRSMNWAATTGLRFNYRLSTRWNANLTGSYQKSVTSGFRSNQSLDSRPYLYGVSWGMRYSF